jgi:putative transposase
MQVIERAYRYRFYPSESQKENLAHTFGCSRWIYNHFLAFKTQSWKESKKKVDYHQCSSILTELKKEHPWLCDVSSVPLQQSLRHLDRAFSNFFGKRARYPSFKSKYDRQCATYTKSAFTFRGGKIKLAKQKEELKICWSRRFKGDPSSLTITRDRAGRYFVSVVVKEKVEELPIVRFEVGLDLGLTHAITDDKGTEVLSPKFLSKELKRLRRRQRSLSKKMKGSKNRERARKELARLHARIRDKRHDFLHKLSWQIVNENQVIAVEDLGVKAMQKNRRLSRGIGDASWGTFVRFLEYKSAWYGRELVKVDRYFPSSKQCSSCGYTLEKLDLKVRRWDCPVCGVLHERDQNAGKNILVEGKRLLRKTEVPWGSRDLKPVEFV